MVTHLLGTEDLDSALEELILEKTEGVPFFAEEFVKSLQDLRAIERRDGTCRIADHVQALTIPAEIQDVIMSRVDALPEGAKNLIQTGSVAGREFSHGLIQQVTGLPEPELLSHLSVLKDSELLYERGIYPQVTYVFKHALIQDVANQSLLTNTRQKHHRRIAQMLEQHFPEAAETQPELLGHHYTEAGAADEAVRYWQKAGDIAVRRSAYSEAISHFSKGLTLLETLPETNESIQQELDLQISLGPVLVATKGIGAQEVGDTYIKAKALCEKIDDTPQLLIVLRGLCHFYLMKSKPKDALDLAEEFLKLAQNHGESSYLIGAHRILGGILFWMGEFAQSRYHLEQSNELYDFQQHYNLAYIYWIDPKSHSLCNLSLLLWLFGFPEQSFQKIKEASIFTKELAHTYSTINHLNWSTILNAFRKDSAAVQENAQELIQISKDKRIPFGFDWGTVMNNWAMASQNNSLQNVDMNQIISSIKNIGSQAPLPYAMIVTAEALISAGQIDKALETLNETQEIINKTGFRAFEAELYRIKGMCILAQSSGDQNEAESYFKQSISIAQKQQAKSLELRTAICLSRLWQSQGKREEARNLLSEIYGWFTEGFDTADLQEAKALLEELSA
jgi:tetratricopeptide (TPR) repeat protein